MTDADAVEILLNGVADTTLSMPFPIGSYDDPSITVEWTGTIAGTLSVFMSDSYDPNKRANGAFTDVGALLAAGTLAAASPNGVAGDSFLDLRTFNGRWFKIGFTKTGGAGTVTAIIFGKGRST